jgi:hypothetical protein
MGFPMKSNSVELPDRLSERNRKHPLRDRKGFKPMVESDHNSAMNFETALSRRSFMKTASLARGPLRHNRARTARLRRFSWP